MRDRRSREVGGSMKRAWTFATPLLLALGACEDGFLVIRTGVFASGSGFCTAMINDANWNCSQSSSQVSGGIIVIFGTGRDPFGRQVDMRLTMHTTVGTAAQQIGVDDIVGAEVTVYDYGVAETWTADGSTGTGTLTLTSINADEVEGNFDFVATGTSSSNAYRISRGSFRAPLR